MYGGLTLEHHQGTNDKSLALANIVQFCCFFVVAFFYFNLMAHPIKFSFRPGGSEAESFIQLDQEEATW